MKQLVMDFPIVKYIDKNGMERIDREKTLDKAKEIIDILKKLNLRFENENE
jgi:hypothetical protein